MTGYVDPVNQQTGYDYADQAYGKTARRRSAWSVLFFIALFVFLAALAGVGYIAYTYWSGQNNYDELTENIQVKDSDEYLTLASFDVDWAALRAINPDVVGWVYLPGTPINYPICWREGTDSYYMTHNFSGWSANGFGAEYGCPVLSEANSPEWTDQMNFVAAHNMMNGTMFAFIEDLQDTELFNEHRTFYLLTPEGNFRLTSFACDSIRGNSKVTVIPNFESKEEFHQYLTNRVNESLVQADPNLPSVDTIDQAVAFYTCSGPDDRFRIMVYCAVEEFLPAGSDVSQGNKLIAKSDVEKVNDSAAERTEE